MAHAPNTLAWEDLTDGGRSVETLADGHEAIAKAWTPFHLAYFVTRCPRTRLYGVRMGASHPVTEATHDRPEHAQAIAQHDFDARALACYR